MPGMLQLAATGAMEGEHPLPQEKIKGAGSAALIAALAARSGASVPQRRTPLRWLPPLVWCKTRRTVHASLSPFFRCCIFLCGFVLFAGDTPRRISIYHIGGPQFKRIVQIFA